jgi:hypothetical protein
MILEEKHAHSVLFLRQEKVSKIIDAGSAGGAHGAHGAARYE